LLYLQVPVKCNCNAAVDLVTEKDFDWYSTFNDCKRRVL